MRVQINDHNTENQQQRTLANLQYFLGWDEFHSVMRYMLGQSQYLVLIELLKSAIGWQAMPR